MSRPTEQLINEVRLLYQSMIQVGEHIHQGSNISMGMRAVLEYLDRNGATTVPQMAKARRVTRQRIQTLVNALAAMRLVEAKDNPASKRSPLIALTPEGARTILEMRRREGAAMKIDISEQKLLEAAQTLAQFRQGLELSLPKQ
jgi:DNA-binding MarR family transcriptional regulator